MDLEKALVLDKIGKVFGCDFFFFPPPPLLFFISPAMNSWVKTCISEGNPGAKLEDALCSAGPEMWAGANQLC